MKIATEVQHSAEIRGEGFGIMKKTEILSNMTAIWLQNQMTEFLLGTDRRKFALSVLVEAEIPRGREGFRKFQPETEIFRSISIDVVPECTSFQSIGLLLSLIHI